MKKLLALTTCLMLGNVFAQDCVQIEANNTKLTWEAYKTPLKAGVKGQFTGIRFHEAAKGESIAKALVGKKFTIDTKTVSTGDTARDATIVKNFFANGDFKIEGVVKSFERRKMVVDLTMNGVTKSVPLQYEIEDKEIEAEGYIDILDFNGSAALSALNKACGALHEGKTWSDVELELEIKTTKC